MFGLGMGRVFHTPPCLYRLLSCPCVIRCSKFSGCTLTLLSNSTLRQAIKSIVSTNETALVWEHVDEWAEWRSRVRAQHYHMVSGNALSFSPARPAGAGKTVAEVCQWFPAAVAATSRPARWVLVALGRQKKPWRFAWEHQYRGSILQGSSHLQKAKLPPPVTHHGSCTWNTNAQH